MIFQGQEFLEDGWFEDVRPLDWGKLERYAGIAALYRDLFRIRRNWENRAPGLNGQGCNVYHVNIDARLIAFHRFDDDPAAGSVVVVNLTARPVQDYWIGLPAPNLWAARFNSDWAGYDPEFDNVYARDVEAIAEGQDGLPAKGAVSLGPYTAIALARG